MPSIRRIVWLDGEFADKMSSIGRNDGKDVIPGITTDGEENRTYRRVEIGGVIVPGHRSNLDGDDPDVILRSEKDAGRRDR